MTTYPRGVGRIEAGKEKGRFIKIIDDRQHSHGFLIVTSRDRQFTSEVYDNWVINESRIAQYFEESGWTITWLDEPLQ